MHVVVWVALLAVIALLVTVVVLQCAKQHQRGRLNVTGSMPDGPVAAAWAFIRNATDAQQFAQSGLHFVSLASILPQDWQQNDTTLLQNIFYDASVYQNGTMKQYQPPYGWLLSVGGSNATAWKPFVQNPQQTAKRLLSLCTQYGFNGLDIDYEAETADVPAAQAQQAFLKIFQLCKQQWQGSKPFITNVSLLLGAPQLWNDMLLADDNLDYVSLMLYNGGMYTASGDGAGCSWDGWADVFLQNCANTTVCTPLNEPVSSYCATATGAAKINPQKILLGVIVDTAGNVATESDIQTAVSLIKQYGQGKSGIIVWVVPGWNNPSQNCNLLFCEFLPMICDAFACTAGSPCYTCS